MPSTVGHITGYLYGMEMPILLGARAVFMDTWNSARAAELIDEQGVTFTIGATPFITELAEFSQANHRPLATLRYFPTGGAPVPPSVIRLAEKTFSNCSAFRIYGSTEAPTITLGDLSVGAHEPRATTEGGVVGHEIRIVDSQGCEAAGGQEGEIVTRGPEVCLGYVKWEDNDAFDSSGYFHTGDLGRMTDAGHLIITGRMKDLIIRGGENISPKEIEDVLATLPAIQNVAVVAMPHERLGETCCAVAVLRAGEACHLIDITALLAARGLAKQKWPERLVIVDRLPCTAAGKVKKNELRDMVKNLAPGGRDFR
jgi:acyl-CoA synthetase (AMP-forming)/AMP-acid ligase II